MDFPIPHFLDTSLGDDIVGRSGWKRWKRDPGVFRCVSPKLGSLWLCQNSELEHGDFVRGFTTLNMMIVHSYVSLPKYNH